MQREVRVPARLVAQNDVRARPHQAPVLTAVHGQRHPLHARGGRAALVDRDGQPLAHDPAERRAVERVGGDAQEPIALVEELVEVRQEPDPLAAARSRAGRRPVRRHAAHVARHRGDRKAVLTVEAVAVRQQEGARPAHALAALDYSGRADRRRIRVRALRRVLGLRTAHGVRDVLHVRPRRVRDRGTHLEHRDRRARRPLAQDARVGRTGGPAADDRDVDGVRIPPRHAAAATSRMYATEAALSVVG